MNILLDFEPQTSRLGAGSRTGNLKLPTRSLRRWVSPPAESVCSMVGGHFCDGRHWWTWCISHRV